MKTKTTKQFERTEALIAAVLNDLNWYVNPIPKTEAELDRIVEKAQKANDAIWADVRRKIKLYGEKDSRIRAGVVKCPICDGSISYRVYTYSGRFWAKCSKAEENDCIHFREK